MRIFVSYHTPDAPRAEALKAALATRIEGADIFFAPHSLKHGVFWQPALSESIEKADAFVILVGEKIGRWQLLEYYAALDRRVSDPGFVLLPLLISGSAPGLPFLSQIHWIETADPAREPDLGAVVAALSGKDAGARGELWRNVNPYRGLESLKEEDADYFFGREAETGKALDLLAGGGNHMVTLIGNSGVGKSSLVEAGLFAALKRQKRADLQPWPEALRDSREWAYVTIRPGEEPVQALVGGIVDLWYGDATDPLRISRRNEWAKLLQSGEAGLDDLMQATRGRFADELGLPAPRRILVNVNQSEELFALSRPEARDRFAELVAAGSGDGGICFVSSLRSDYYGYLQNSPRLFECSTLVDVRPFDREGLTNVITGPARRLGVRFEADELPAHIVRGAAGDRGALPLLADFMTEVWARMQTRGDGMIRFADQAALVDAGRALSERADRYLREHPEDVDTVMRLFILHLSTTVDDSEPVRKPVAAERLSEREIKVANALASQDWRLLSIGGDASPSIDVTHEILLARWETYRTWVYDRRSVMSYKSFLQKALEQYEKAPRRLKKQSLLSGNLLKSAIDSFVAQPDMFDDRERDFIRRSALRDQRLVGLQKPLWSSFAYAFVTTVAMALGGVVGSFLVEEKGQRLGPLATWSLFLLFLAPLVAGYVYLTYRGLKPYGALLSRDGGFPTRWFAGKQALYFILGWVIVLSAIGFFVWIAWVSSTS